MDKIKESDLYGPVKEYLDSLGYDTKAEVKDCDIAAVKDDTLIVVELKTGFTIDLIYQAIDRQRIADGVYVAIPLPKRGYMSPHYNDMKMLCRQLEIGLIFVGFTQSGKGHVDVLLHPKEFAGIRMNRKKRLAVITEHNARTGSVNTGGVTRRKIMTAYREDALRIVKILSENEPLKTEEIRKLGGCEKTSTILSRNFYKWFKRQNTEEKGKPLYSVTEAGLAALEEYRDLLEE